VIAYKCLRSGGVGPFSAFRWPLPADGPGAWVAAEPRACASGIHACRVEQLPYWLNWELWEVELAGAVGDTGRKLVAARGRLMRRVEEWDHAMQDAFCRACADRVVARRSADPVLAGYADDATQFLDQCEPPAMMALLGARAAEVAQGPAGRESERRWQGRWLTDHLPTARR
jgi:hypothetical protein